MSLKVKLKVKLRGVNFEKAKFQFEKPPEG